MMNNIMNSLLIMGLGMLAIFVVLIVIYLAVLVLLKIGNINLKKKKN